MGALGEKSAILEIITNHNHKLDPVGSDDSFRFF